MMADAGMCRAMTGAGTPVTVYAHGQAALRIMRKTDSEDGTDDPR